MFRLSTPPHEPARQMFFEKLFSNPILLSSMTFRLFFPSDIDQFTVICPDNSTYWLILLVRSDSISQYKPVYYVAVILEVSSVVVFVILVVSKIVALTIGYTIHIRGFVLFCKMRVSRVVSFMHFYDFIEGDSHQFPSNCSRNVRGDDYWSNRTICDNSVRNQNIAVIRYDLLLFLDKQLFYWKR